MHPYNAAAITIPSDMKNYRLLVAEDQAILREGLKALLKPEADLEVVGEAADGREAIRLVGVLHPDLVLMDLSMPYINGTEAIPDIKRRHPAVKIVVLTVHKAEEYVRAVLQMGASGYVLKDDTHHELLTAIRNALRGRTYLSPGICGTIVNGFLDPAATARAPSALDALTHRERQIVKLIAEGYKNKEIANYLSLSCKTVEKHRSNAMGKLKLRTASALTAFAIQNGLLGKV